MTPATSKSLLPIGEIASRAGLSVPTVRYYESRNLITSERTAGNKRLFRRYTLRRLAVIAAGQRVGLTLAEIAEALAELPTDRASTQEQWHQLSTHWAQMVARSIRQLEKLQGSLDDCIGCGCLSQEVPPLQPPRRGGIRRPGVALDAQEHGIRRRGYLRLNAVSCCPMH